MPARTLLILGATGDLTARLLLPGLGELAARGGAEGLSLVGSGTSEGDDEAFRRQVAESFAAGRASGPEVDAMAREARYLSADATSGDDLRRLLDACEPPVVVYFALPPSVTEAACRALVEIGLPAETRLVLEKPFGADARSAEALNTLLARLVPEDRVHRVDHFLGMSTVLNILGLRFANRILEPVLNAQHVAAVEIVFDEELGLEGRAGYYDRAGALVDMIQSHLLQVLALVAMEPPSTLDARDVRDGKAQVLRATRVWDDDPAAFSRRARYTAGSVAGRPLPAYADEEGVDAGRGTETLAEVVLAVDTWRWAGVPFRLRSGKAIGGPRQEIAVTFARAPWVPTGLRGYDVPDRLHMGIGPGAAGMGLELNINAPGDPFSIESVTLEAAYGAGALSEYGEVLRGVLADDPSLSVRGDTAVECWRIVEPVLASWQAGAPPLGEYAAGSSGSEGGDVRLPRGSGTSRP
jgi:glucose-6-phosphate 1-dehydrogenase